MDWDPKEWQWRKLGGLEEETLFNNRTKRVYMIGLRHMGQQVPMERFLESHGFSR